MVKKQRTRKASSSEAKRFASKAIEYRRAMVVANQEGLWDVAISNGVHALLLMANALTAIKSGEYFAGQDHNRAAGFLLETVGPEANAAAKRMQFVISLKSTAEYDYRACTRDEASDVIKRTKRFFTWAEERLPP